MLDRVQTVSSVYLVSLNILYFKLHLRCSVDGQVVSEWTLKSEMIIYLCIISNRERERERERERREELRERERERDEWPKQWDIFQSIFWLELKFTSHLKHFYNILEVLFKIIFEAIKWPSTFVLMEKSRLHSLPIFCQYNQSQWGPKSRTKERNEWPKQFYFFQSMLWLGIYCPSHLNHF